MQPTIYVNLFHGHYGLEAHDGVWIDRAEAAEAAEDYAATYAYTLTDTGKVDLRPDFSSEYHRTAARDANIDRFIDEMKEIRMGRAS